MGTLEKELRKKRKKENIQKIILSSIYGAGMLSVGILAPNIVGVLGKFVGKKLLKKEYTVKRSITRLIESGLIEFETTPKGKFLKLTARGERKLKTIYDSNGHIKKPKRWDKKWRIVIYDFSEKKKLLRNKIRSLLIQFGFLRLQDSVWIYPYDCEDLITLIKVDSKIGKEVLYMIVDFLENDKWIKKAFSIS